MSKDQKFFELVPSGTNIQFVANRWRYLMLSIIAVVLSIGALGYNQVTTGNVLNFGIDFQGGSQVRLAFTEPVDVGEVREALDRLEYQGASVVAVPDADNEVMIRVKETVSISADQEQACQDAAMGVEPGLHENGFAHPENSSKIFLKYSGVVDAKTVEQALNAAGCEGTAEAVLGKEGEFPVEFTLIGIGSKLAEQLDAELDGATVDHIVASETVGAKVGEQLKTDGGMAMLMAIGLIFLFVMIRFDLRFAPGGIVALIHDSIIVIGAFAVTGKEFNLQTIAALLTIIGYSINDTIVVFDRIREKVALNREAPIEQTTNEALNETLSRTALTSLTTLIVVLMTLLMGSGPIKDFAFALIVGVIVGTYSSLFVAAPVFLWVNHRFYAGKGHLLSADREDREGTGTLLGVGGGGGGTGGGGAADGGEDEPEARPAAGGGAKRRRRRRSSGTAEEGSSTESKADESSDETDADVESGADAPVEADEGDEGSSDDGDEVPEVNVPKVDAADPALDGGGTRRRRRRRPKSE